MKLERMKRSTHADERRLGGAEALLDLDSDGTRGVDQCVLD